MLNLSKLTIALAVTAAVTFGAQAQNAGVLTGWRPNIVNLDTGHHYPYTKRGWDTKDGCTAAMGNLPSVLADLRDPAKVTAPDPEGDEDLVQNVLGLTLQILMNTGKMPQFDLVCEKTGDPA